MDRPRQTKAGSLTPRSQPPLARRVGAARRSSRSDRERDHVRFPARTRNVARPDQVGGPHAMEHDPKLVAGTLAEFFAAEH